MAGSRSRDQIVELPQGRDIGELPADLAADRIPGEVPRRVLAEVAHRQVLAEVIDQQRGVTRAITSQASPSVGDGCTGRPLSASTRSRNNHGRPRQPRPTTTPSQPVCAHHRAPRRTLPRCRRCRAPGSRAPPTSARRSRSSRPSRRSAARLCARAARWRRRPRRRRSGRSETCVSNESNRPLRNLMVTGTPYGDAAATAVAKDGAQQVRLGGHRSAAALAGDLGSGAAEVDVDVIDAIGVAQQADRLADHHRIAAVDLQAARLLVGGRTSSSARSSSCRARPRSP